MTFEVGREFNIELAIAINDLQTETGMPLSDWFGSGRRSPEGDLKWWQENGPELVHRYIDWYEASPDVNVWITPDGKPAIELDLTVLLGEVYVRVIIDQVLTMGTALVVLDMKSGTKSPENVIQLAIAATAIEKTYGTRPRYGGFFMHRETDNPFIPVQLTGWQHREEHLARVFGNLDRAINTGIFIPNVGQHCRRCGVAGSCPAMGHPAR